MPDVMLPSLRSSKPEDALLVRTSLVAATSSALRLSAFADPSSPELSDRRRRGLMARGVREQPARPSRPAAPKRPFPPSSRPLSFLGSGASRRWHIAPSLTGRRRPRRVHLRASQASSVSSHCGSLGRLSTRIQNEPPARPRRSFRLLSRPPWSNLGLQRTRFARR